jgi:hypothetical protein
MAESLLLGVLGKDFGDGVFKYLAPRTLARLETTFTRELVFVPLGEAQALLLSVAQRRHAEAAKAGDARGAGGGAGGAGDVGDGVALDLHGDGAAAGRRGKEFDQRGWFAFPGDVG